MSIEQFKKLMDDSCKPVTYRQVFWRVWYWPIDWLERIRCRRSGHARVAFFSTPYDERDGVFCPICGDQIDTHQDKV